MKIAGTDYNEHWEKRLLAMHGATDTEEFIDAVFKLLAATVDCDVQVALLKNVDGLPMVAHDSRGRYFGPEYMSRFFKVNPGTLYVLLHPGLRILPTKGHLPPETKLKASAFYKEFMQPEGWRHSVAIFVWGGFPPTPRSCFCALRSEDKGDFSDEEIERLRKLQPHIATAVKRMRSQLKDRSMQDAFAQMLKQLPFAGMLLDWDLRIVHQNIAAREWCAAFFGRGKIPTARQTRLPAGLLSACRELRTRWRDAIRRNAKPDVSISQSFSHPSRPGLTAEVSLVFCQSSALAYPCFLLQFRDVRESGPRLNLEHPMLLTLTPGEREAVLLAAAGLDNAAIAARLGRSVPAVKLRLHGAFRKLKVSSRVQLALLLR